MLIDGPIPIEFHLNDAVRLVARVGDVPAGARGRVLGRFARETNPTYVVSFDAGVLELRGVELLAIAA